MHATALLVLSRLVVQEMAAAAMCANVKNPTILKLIRCRINILQCNIIRILSGVPSVQRMSVPVTCD